MNQSPELIQKFPFYPYLTDEEVQVVQENTGIKKAAKGEILYGGDVVCLGMAHILSGKIRLYIVSEEGREITLYNLEKGDNCVMSASCVVRQITFETIMVAEEDSEILLLPSSIFSDLTERNIYVKANMYEMLMERFSQVMWVMQEILFFGFDRRLARFLLAESEKTGNATIVMTQEKLAQQVNSAREVVARMLKRFASDGLVELKHGSIVLTDIPALKLLQ